MLTIINHIGIAVKSLEDSIPFYRDNLGMELKGIEDVAEFKVRVAFLKIGESKIELLEPLDETSNIAKFLEKNGEGFHHICYEVDNIEEKLKLLENQGIPLIDKTPRDGAHNTKVAFIHPKGSGRVLTELCQPK